MPSHLSLSGPRPDFVSELDLYANSQADKLARDAADKVCVPLSVSSPILYHYNLVNRIQRRLATIVSYFPERARHKSSPTPKSAKMSLSALMATSAHVPYFKGTRVKCARCLQSYHKDDSACIHFLQSSCSGVGNAIDRPIPLNYEAIHVGNKTTHHTHVLYTFKALVYCNKCGMRAYTHMHKLSRPCQPPSAYGLETIKAIGRGMLPSKSGSATSLKDKHSSSRSGRIRGIPYPGESVAIAGVAEQEVVYIPPIVQAPPIPYPLVPPHSNLPELLELAREGEKVILPDGHTISTAQQYLEDYSQAVKTAYMYTHLYYSTDTTVHRSCVPAVSQPPMPHIDQQESPAAKPVEVICPMAKPKALSCVTTPRVRRF